MYSMRFLNPDMVPHRLMTSMFPGLKWLQGNFDISETYNERPPFLKDQVFLARKKSQCFNLHFCVIVTCHERPPGHWGGL